MNSIIQKEKFDVIVSLINKFPQNDHAKIMGLLQNNVNNIVKSFLLQPQDKRNSSLTHLLSFVLKNEGINAYALQPKNHRLIYVQIY